MTSPRPSEKRATVGNLLATEAYALLLWSALLRPEGSVLSSVLQIVSGLVMLASVGVPRLIWRDDEGHS